MHNLEQRIAEWRKSILTGPSPTIRPEVLDELENHLRENVDQLLQTGLTETEAFQRAAATLGAALGFVAYTTYDLTNQATLRAWPLHVTLIDLAWGTFLTASAALGGYWLANRMG